ncbi:MAG TPA: hypothetical protein DD379_16855 [Cyanobacteria bacterium UBA11162]|nr:hypothetical protein [Cyanobacteria bacterium UBA11162]
MEHRTSNGEGEINAFSVQIKPVWSIAYTKSEVLGKFPKIESTVPAIQKGRMEKNYTRMPKNLALNRDWCLKLLPILIKNSCS